MIRRRLLLGSVLLGLAGLQGCATVTQLPAFSYQLPDNRETDVAQVIATLPAERDASSEPRLVATAMQTVGVKGYDGFAIALVTG